MTEDREIIGFSKLGKLHPSYLQMHLYLGNEKRSSCIASPKAGLFSLAFRSLAYLCPSVGIMGSLAGEC